MYDYGAKYKSLCEAQCRHFKVYVDIYDNKGTDDKGKPIYEYSHTLTSGGSKGAIISIKATRGQTSGGFSFGKSFSGQLTMVVTPDTVIDNNESRLDIFVSFIDSDGTETEKAPLGVFFIQTVTKAAYSKTVKAVDGMTFLSKYFTNWVTLPAPLSMMFRWCTVGTKLQVDYSNFINDPVVSLFPYKNEGAEKDGEKYYTCREFAEMVASANAGNAFITAEGKVKIAVADFSKTTEIPLKSVISYTDSFTENKFTSVFWAATYEGTVLPSALDPQSPDYDPSIMVVDFPVSIIDSALSPLEMKQNIEKAISNVKYSGITVKKRGTGLYEIGDVLRLNDTHSGKTFDNIFVMGITYTISATEGFTETLHSLARTESQQQTQGLSLETEIANKGGGVGGLPPITGITVNDYGDFTLDTNSGGERYIAVF